MNQLNLSEFQKNLNYLIDNNHNLIDKGDTPIAICIEGDAGLGKTAVVEEVAKNKNMTFVKINLAQIEEPAELVGFPYKEYKVKINNEEHWVSSDILSALNKDAVLTKEVRMSYATPSWLPREFNPNGTMLVLDDFSRSNSLIIQAVMEIINTGSYISWKLPKYTSVVLTTNPDDGQYSVNSLDKAVVSRMITFKGKFDIEIWAKWADSFGIDSRAINFALSYNHELFEEVDQSGEILANARSYTTFCRAISGLSDWSDSKSLEIIHQICAGCFFDENNVVGNLFTTFIHNRLDKLIEAKDIIDLKWETLEQKLHESLYSSGSLNANVANILRIRLENYLEKYFKTKGSDPEKVKDRLIEFINSPVRYFTKDQLFKVISKITNEFKVQTNSWYRNSDIRNTLM